MNRKRNTQLYQNLRLPKPSHRRSLKHSPPQQTQTKIAVEGMVRSIIAELVSEAEQIIEFKEKSAIIIKEWLEMTELQLHRYFQLSIPSHHSHIECETEPIKLNQYLIPISQPNYKSNTKEQCGDKETQETQLDSNIETQIKRRRQSHLRRWQQSKTCLRNEFVILNPHYRVVILQSEDRSQQLQALLRRKKQLLNYQKTARINTQISRTSSTKTFQRDKKPFWQDDEGEVHSIVSKSINNGKKPQVPPLKLADIKVAEGQQICRNPIKKKTIVDLATARKRKRKDIGDTCVFIEQMREKQKTLQDLSEIIEVNCKDRSGVTLIDKERRLTTIIRLPSIR